MSEKPSIRRIMFETRSATVPPIIRLKGQWLVSAGFITGQHVDVVISGPGELFIRQQQQHAHDADEAEARALAAFAAVGL